MNLALELGGGGGGGGGGGLVSCCLGALVFFELYIK